MPSKVRKPGGLFDKHPERIEEGLKRLQNIRKISTQRTALSYEKFLEMKELQVQIMEKIAKTGKISKNDVNVSEGFLRDLTLSINRFRNLINNDPRRETKKTAELISKLLEMQQLRTNLKLFIEKYKDKVE